jgi:hypothetical protein
LDRPSPSSVVLRVACWFNTATYELNLRESGYLSFQVGSASRPLRVLCGMFVSLVLSYVCGAILMIFCYVCQYLGVRSGALIFLLTNVRLCSMVSVILSCRVGRFAALSDSKLKFATR